MVKSLHYKHEYHNFAYGICIVWYKEDIQKQEL